MSTPRFVSPGSGPRPAGTGAGAPKAPLIPPRPRIPRPEMALNDPRVRMGTEPPVQAEEPRLRPRSLEPAIEEHTTQAPEPILDSSWERISAPSRDVPYDWEGISLRHLDAMDQAKLARAVRHRSLTLVLDVLSSTCNRDLRDMCAQDFRAICLWHKLNSYLSAPTTITFTSRYGNKCRTQIKRTAVRENPLKATRAEYLLEKDKGLAVPTMRDAELLASYQMDEDTEYLFIRAQNLNLAPLAARIAELTAAGDRAPTVTARVERLVQISKTPGLAILEELDKFSERYNDFGIVEVANVVDSRFDTTQVLKYAEYMEATANAIDDLAEQEPDTPLTPRDLARRDGLREEATKFRQSLVNGETMIPQEEEIPLAFSLWSMFPYT